VYLCLHKHKPSRPRAELLSERTVLLSCYTKQANCMGKGSFECVKYASQTKEIVVSWALESRRRNCGVQCVFHNLSTRVQNPALFRLLSDGHSDSFAIARFSDAHRHCCDSSDYSGVVRIADMPSLSS